MINVYKRKDEIIVVENGSAVYIAPGDLLRNNELPINEYFSTADDELVCQVKDPMKLGWTYVHDQIDPAPGMVVVNAEDAVFQRVDGRDYLCERVIPDYWIMAGTERTYETLPNGTYTVLRTGNA